MARPKSLHNLTSDDLFKLWEKKILEEEDSKRKELAEAEAKVKELKAYFVRFGKNAHKLKGVKVKTIEKKPRAKRGGLKKAVLALLKKSPQPIKGIVKATKSNYGTVSQLLVKLKKDKVIIQGDGRGAPYTLASK